MNCSLWHLAGQIYCSLYGSEQEVTEATLLDENKFVAALKESNVGLSKAFKRCPQTHRKVVRALVGRAFPGGDLGEPGAGPQDGAQVSGPGAGGGSGAGAGPGRSG